MRDISNIDFYAHCISDTNFEPLFSENCPALKNSPCLDCEKLNHEHGHLNKVAYLSKKFAQAFLKSGQDTHSTFSQLAYIQGLWHDLGKFSKEFQNRIRGAPHRPDHATIGAQKAVQSFPEIGHLIAFGIAGHHTGLMDTDSNNSCYKKRIQNSDLPKLISPLPKALDEINENFEQLNLKFPPSLKEKLSQSSNSEFTLSLITRFLFSCLIDADFLATEAFMDPKKHSQRPNYQPHDTLKSIADLLDQKLKDFPAPAPEDTVNQQRAKVLADCSAKAHQPPGIFTLTVPTGGGKTLSSFKFAVEHALKYNKERIIYVIPFTSIIEQNAQVFREIIAPLETENFTPIIEHHSALEPKKERFDTKLATENWDAPIIITTAVQFYESLFASKTSRSRKVHNIANSVIILDEAQTLPVDYLKPCLSIIRTLSDFFDATLVLCTATQPAIKINDDFTIGLEKTTEIIKDVPSLYSTLKRVRIESLGELPDRDLIHQFKNHKQALCIVNRRKHAQELFGVLNQVSDSKANFHLSALMCPKHRSETLVTIKDRLEKNKATKVIATQVVEAGVDIDFPIVYRSLAGLDSIAQSAGRCNRNGRLDTGGVTYVFKPEDSEAERYFRETAQVANEIMELYDDLLSPEAVERYFDLYYHQQKDRWDKKKILEEFHLTNSKAFPLQFQFKQADKHFKLIENTQVPILIPYDTEAKKALNTLRNENIPLHRDLLRQLQAYSVNIPEYLFQENINLFESIRDDNFYALSIPLKPDYSNKTGLILKENNPN